MLRLFFVRHGRTPWNVRGRVQGGGGLDEVGRAQAAALAERLGSEPLDAIYASPTLRARQTARAVARRQTVPVQQRSLLRDLDYGRYAGALLDDVNKERPELVRQWREQPHTVHFEDGEGLTDLRRRVTRFIRETSSRHGSGTVLAATHDSPVRVAVSLALGIEDAEHNRDDLKIALASLTLLEVEDGHLTLRYHSVTEHLRGIDGAS